MCLLLALRRNTVRFVICTLALAVSMVLGDRRVHDIVLWWPALMATATVTLLSAAPPRKQWRRLVAGLRTARDTTRPVECKTMKETVGAGRQHA